MIITFHEKIRKHDTRSIYFFSTSFQVAVDYSGNLNNSVYRDNEHDAFLIFQDDSAYFINKSSLPLAEYFPESSISTCYCLDPPFLCFLRTLINNTRIDIRIPAKTDRTVCTKCSKVKAFLYASATKSSHELSSSCRPSKA